MATSVQWRDLTLTTGADAPYRITAIDGWEGLPPARYDKQSRSRAHGAHSSPVFADERIVTVEGFSWQGREQRDALLFALQRRFTFDGGEEPLTITLAGRTLTAGAQLLRCDPTLVRDEWGIGRFGWVAQWRCPDPLRYGQPMSVTTGLPYTSGAGLQYPLEYPLDYGTPGGTGQITVRNSGTADAPIRFTVTGELPAGFEIAARTQRITYAARVPAGQTVDIDTATGSVVVEGTADRRGNLIDADWIHVPAGGSLTVQFTSRTVGYYSSASLTATVREAHW